MSQQNQQTTALAEFRGQLAEQSKGLSAMLPPGVISRERFLAATGTAVNMNPSLLTLDRHSLFVALQQAAVDGILPDGREGAIVPFKGKAAWVPMVKGIRRRAWEIDRIVASAKVVYANDEFAWYGDGTFTHIPARMTEEPGEMVGACAIFKRGNEAVHYEAMRKNEIEAVRNRSQGKNGPLWNEFTAEAWKKTVVRRGFKSLPVSDMLGQIIERGDEDFDFSDKPRQTRVERVEAPAEGEATALPPRVGEDPEEEEPQGQAVEQATEESGEDLDEAARQADEASQGNMGL